MVPRRSNVEPLIVHLRQQILACDFNIAENLVAASWVERIVPFVMIDVRDDSADAGVLKSFRGEVRNGRVGGFEDGVVVAHGDVGGAAAEVFSQAGTAAI